MENSKSKVNVGIGRERQNAEWSGTFGEEEKEENEKAC